MSIWTLETLEKLENDIIKLFLTTNLSDAALADSIGSIDIERLKINQANSVITGDEIL